MDTSSSVSQNADTVDESVTLTDLLPGSTYRVSVSGRTKAGNTAILEADLKTQVGGRGLSIIREISSGDMMIHVG